MNDETLLSALPERFLDSDQSSCPFGGLSFALNLSPTECERLHVRLPVLLPERLLTLQSTAPSAIQ
jgi:hypothetical protein